MRDAVEPMPRRRSRFAVGLAAAVAPPRDPFAATGVSIYVVFVLIAIFSLSLATHDPLEILFHDDGKLVAGERPSRARPPRGLSFDVSKISRKSAERS